jgi:alpha-glucosidase
MYKIEIENRIWWKHGVVYHIYVRSFADSNHDGIGDIPGIIGKLNYLADLGVDAIWLSPVFASPNVDFGYDVSDFNSISPDYGTMDDFIQLVNEAHNLGIRIILDIIMNHTSDQHPWFTESRSSLTNPKRDWYIWQDGKSGNLPNNWKSATGGSAWKFDPLTNQYYLHSFFEEQPDLNWRNQQLSDAFFGIFQFWLDLGVDGFRLDVVNFIVKDKKFRDNPVFPMFPFLQQPVYTRNRSRSFKIVKDLRKLMDGYEDKMTVGEIYVMPPGDPEAAVSYLGKGDNSLNLAFDFSLMFKPWNAHQYINTINNYQKQIPKQGWPCHVLSNHDLFRSINRFPFTRNKTEKAKVAAVLLLTLRGTPFIYYGEEIGMPNSRIPQHAIRDSLGKRYWPFFTGRDKARTPMQWNDGLNAGFSDVKPWLPVDNSYHTTNVENESLDERSLFQVYKKMIQLRKKHPALQMGRWVPLLNGKNGVACLLRFLKDERIIILLNFTGNTIKLDLQEHLFGEVLFSTHRSTSEVKYLKGLRVLPFEATVLLDSAYSRYLSDGSNYDD